MKEAHVVIFLSSSLQNKLCFQTWKLISELCIYVSAMILLFQFCLNLICKICLWYSEWLIYHIKQYLLCRNPKWIQYYGLWWQAITFRNMRETHAYFNIWMCLLILHIVHKARYISRSHTCMSNMVAQSRVFCFACHFVECIIASRGWRLWTVFIANAKTEEIIEKVATTEAS